MDSPVVDKPAQMSEATGEARQQQRTAEPSGASDDFTFAQPSEPKPAKVPLTANATVVDRSSQEVSGSMPPPPPVPVSQARPASAGRFKPRQKVKAEYGMTQLEFMQSKKDMSGLNGGPRRRGISKAEVAEHRTAEDAWVILRGKVYNLTPYLPFHPGGSDILVATAGKDCTALFDKYHRWVNSDFLLKNCFIGLIE